MEAEALTQLTHPLGLNAFDWGPNSQSMMTNHVNSLFVIPSTPRAASFRNFL